MFGCTFKKYNLCTNPQHEGLGCKFKLVTIAGYVFITCVKPVVNYCILGSLLNYFLLIVCACDKEGIYIEINM